MLEVGYYRLPSPASGNDTLQRSPTAEHTPESRVRTNQSQVMSSIERNVSARGS